MGCYWVEEHPKESSPVFSLGEINIFTFTAFCHNLCLFFSFPTVFGHCDVISLFPIHYLSSLLSYPAKKVLAGGWGLVNILFKEWAITYSVHTNKPSSLGRLVDSNVPVPSAHARPMVATYSFSRWRHSDVTNTIVTSPWVLGCSCFILLLCERRKKNRLLTT